MTDDIIDDLTGDDLIDNITYNVTCGDLRELLSSNDPNMCDDIYNLISNVDPDDIIIIPELIYYYLIGNYVVQNNPNTIFANNKIKNVIFIGFFLTKESVFIDGS